VIGTASDDLLIVSKTVFLEVDLCSVGQLTAVGQEVKTFVPGVTVALPQPQYLALAWARLVDKDRALEWLGREYAERSEARFIDEEAP